MAPIGIACALYISRGGAQQSFVEQHGQLSVSGTRIVDKNGSPVTLRGMSLYWSQWQPDFYNASCIKWLRDDWKCTIVRPAMAVQSGGYLTNLTAKIAKVKTVVQACIDLGIYCQIDYHETANGMDNLSKAQTLVHVPRPKGHQLVQLVGFGDSGSVRDSSTQSSIRLCQRRLGRKRFKTIGKVRENLFMNSKSGDRAV